jgi:hypothetical protein
MENSINFKQKQYYMNKINILLLKNTRKSNCFLSFTCWLIFHKKKKESGRMIEKAYNNSSSRLPRDGIQAPAPNMD